MTEDIYIYRQEIYVSLEVLGKLEGNKGQRLCNSMAQNESITTIYDAEKVTAKQQGGTKRPDRGTFSLQREHRV